MSNMSRDQREAIPVEVHKLEGYKSYNTLTQNLNARYEIETGLRVACNSPVY